MLRFVSFAILPFLVLAAELHGVTIGTPKDYPAGTIRFSLKDNDRAAHLVSISWGGETEESGSAGPTLAIKSPTAGESEKVKIDAKVFDRLFGVARRLAGRHTLPRSSKGDRSNRSSFQLYIGLLSDPVRLNYPANEPHLWNQAVACWKEYTDVLEREVSVSLPAATPLATNEKAPAPGDLSISDFTSLRVNATRVHRTKIDYGTISAAWNRAKDGKITFTSRYTNRAADGISATPPTKDIRPLFDLVRKLTKSHRHPSFAGKGKAARSRSYDSVELYIEPAGQPGECMLTYFSSDPSQWADANQLWSLLVKLFPEERREDIIQ